MVSRPIVHHTLLQLRGGATRVARILKQLQNREPPGAAHLFEVAETRAGEVGHADQPWPQALQEHIAAGALLHLHATADWAGLLQAVMPAAGRVVVTLHDQSLLTGGCTNALDCPHFAKDCDDPCPRGFEHSAQRRTLQRRLLEKLSPVLVSPSRWLAKIARSALPGHEVRVIPNGVPWPEAPPDRRHARQAAGIAPGARVVLFIAHGGTGAAYKAGGQWQAMWEGIKAARPEAVGFFVGGPEHQRQGDLAFLPYLDEVSLCGLLAAGDLLCYPTLADNHPLIVLEAMSQCCPVLAWAVGGVPEQIEHGRTGLLTRPGDADQMVAAAAAALGRPRDLRALARMAFDKGGRRFSENRMHLKYQDTYTALSE